MSKHLHISLFLSIFAADFRTFCQVGQLQKKMYYY